MPSFGNDWHCGPLIANQGSPFVRVFDIRKFRTVSPPEDSFINHLLNSFKNGEHKQSQLIPEISERRYLDGMSGTKTRHFYNNLASLPECTYLEIGTWAGSTLCSNLFNNNINATAIDNFAWGGRDIKKKFLNNVSRCISLSSNSSTFNIPNNVFSNLDDKQYNINLLNDKALQVIDSDSFQVNLDELQYIYNLYLYDGDHSYDAHYKALTYYYSKLADIFIFIVDDWNIPRVRDATNRAIKDLNLTILAECEVIYTHDDTHTSHNDDFASNNFWNGVYAAVLRK
jgi:hypothetical protein